MERSIVRDVMFLSRKAEPATQADIPVGADLLDTLHANSDRCVGMAANMIGVNKKIIVIHTGVTDVVMFNPKIIRKKDRYETEEGCLSLSGVRKAERYRSVTVEYTDMQWKKRTLSLTGFPAQICLHEMDHLGGIVI